MTTASAAETSGANAIYLVQLLRGFMERGQIRGVKSFPQLFSYSWHELLYALKQKYPEEFHGFNFLSGDLDRISPDLDNAMHGLPFVCDERSRDYRISLKQDILPIKDSKFFSGGENFDKVVATALEVAGKIDGFLEY